MSAAANTAGPAIPVTPDNFTRAETDLMLAGVIADSGLGRLKPQRQPLPLDYPVIRPNRDTLYSTAVFDLAAGPVTITLPDAGDRFLALQVGNQDHYCVGVFYGAGAHTFTQEQIGTRYIVMGVRILVDPNDPHDVAQVHALQDAIGVEQSGGPGSFEVPNWDQASQDKVRGALLVLSETLPDLRRAFGRKDEVDPVRHLIGTASGWGGNPDKDATYLNVTPTRNDGETVYRLVVPADVPVDSFWSVSVYDANGHFAANPRNAYAINSITAQKSDDGTVVVQFGGCDGQTPNCLPTVPGWNYLVRLYRPRAEILDGTWTFPEAQPIN